MSKNKISIFIQANLAWSIYKATKYYHLKEVKIKLLFLRPKGNIVLDFFYICRDCI